MNKMTVFRRIFAWVLLLCMLVGLMPVHVFATQEGAEAKVETKAATNYVSQINSLATPYNEAYNDTVQDYSNISTGVYYYVVNKASDTQGHLLAMNEKFTGRYYHATDVAISGNSLTDPNPDSAVKFVLGDNTTRASIHPIKGVTTRIAGLVDETYVSIYRSTPGILGGRLSDGKRIFLSFMGDISYAKNSWFSLQYVPTRVSGDEFYGDDGFSVIFHKDHEEKYIEAELMQLYRVYTQGFELYKAIKAMVGYADGNADGRYPEALYAEFSGYLASCISTYNANNKAVDTADEARLKEAMDAMATTLLSYRDDLTKNDSSWSFIDIPVEVLDFRADGMVFEWSGSNTGYYSLWGAPGSTVEAPLTPGQNVRIGLTEEYLVDGQIIYKESTIKTVAQGLQKKVGYDWGTDGRIPGWNGAFYAKMNELTDLGTFAATIAKTDTKANGGYLNWSQVETCYDMAYYMLSNFWRAVKDGDNIDTVNDLGYNTVVNERKRLRLYMDKETGYYTMDASNVMCYDGYYSFNAMPESPTTRLPQDAFFTPADNLGFETAAYKELLGDTDQGRDLAQYHHELAETNYHFSLHAEGSFVYYRDQNLYFQFIGDDDVYFYIDGRRVMDLGADHPPAGDELYLNNIADQYGWVDGGVYSFDMFYIERHTARANLKFSTNIKIVETETMTTKGMYLENSNGVSKVNSTTGMGEELAENALLRDGDIVAYSFNIANSRDIPVYSLSFDDTTLGTTLSPSTVTLCDTSLTGGVSTAISDIKVYYRTLEEDGTFYSGYPITKSYAEMKALIETANGIKTSLNTGNYMVSPGTVDNLKNLLKLGIPANCQMIIYGFKRQAQESVPTYQNTVNSLCYYNLSGTAQTTPGAEEIPVNGSASRTYKVTAEPPTSQKLELVLDYGKAIEIPTETIGKNIQTDSLTTVTGFAGLVTSGSHEQVLTYISPSNLKCSSVGQTYAGKQGTFTRTAKGLDYQPTKFMDTIETVYLVFNITATNSEYKYMLVELKLLPATFVYYETDFTDGAIRTLNGSNVFNPDECVFIDFNSSEADTERYKSSVYGGKNYDTGNWLLRTANLTNLKYDTDAGTLSVTRPVSVSEDRPYLHYVQANNLNYDPTNAEVLIVRMKLENFEKYSGGTQKFYVDFYSVEDGKNIQSYGVNPEEDAFLSGEFMTIEVPIDTLGSYGKTVKNIRIHATNVVLKDKTKAGTITVDYLYVGPENGAPAGEQLFVDFSRSETAQKRYSTRPYGDYNYDTAGWDTRGDNMNAATYNTNGTMSATANGKTASSNPNIYYLQMKGLNYVPAGAEVFVARVKLENFNAVTNATPQAYVDFIDKNGTRLKQCTGYKIDVSDITNKAWFLVTIPVTAVQNCGNIAYVRLNITNITNASTNGTIYLDYFYVGPESGVPAQEYLYFDFNNSETAQERYRYNTAYNGKNYDTGNWILRNGAMSDLTYDNEAGTLSAIRLSTVSITNPYIHYLQAQNLTYYPGKEAEVLIARLKVEDFKELDSGGDPTFYVDFYDGVDTGAFAKYYYTIDSDYLENENYFEAKINISTLAEKARKNSNNGKVQYLRVHVSNVENASASVNGKITIDYVYVGREDDFHKVIAANNQTWQTITDSTSAHSDYQDQEFINISTEEKITSRLETIGAGPAILSEYYGIRNGLGNYNNNIPLSFSHRGSFRTSSENSYLAILESLNQGMDGVEIDLMITSDNVVVLSHDKTLSRTTGDNVTIADVTWDSMKDYPLEVGNGTGNGQDYTLTADEAALLNTTLSNYVAHYGEAATSGGKHYTARLDDVLELIKKKAPNAILTFDKVNEGQNIFVYSYKAAYEAGMLKNVFFKLGKNAATLKTWASAAATACGITQAEVLSSMQMLWVIGVPTASTVDSLKSYRNNGINVVALEGSWGTMLTDAQENEIINTVMPYCRENNIDFWPTVIGPGWAGQLDDEETTWAYYLEKLGVDGLMTDRPEEFGVFMHYYNGASRSTSELIQAEHFQSYNLGSAKFYMNEAADTNNNKLVNELHNGDYLEYRNITFTGSENTLYATAKGLNGGGTLKFYVDSMKEENCFASISFGSSSYCVTRIVTMHKTVSKGSHTVYVQARGKEGVALLSFDSYTFQKQSDDHYLFFDFNNTAEDQTRYKKAIYGSSYNFDIQDYWATYASDNSSDRVNKTNFSIDNAEGVAKVNVGDDFEGEKVYCGPKFMTTKTYGKFPYASEGANAPLKYVPSPNDYLVVRFKLENVIAGSDYTPMLFMEYHWNNAAGTDNIKYEDLKADYTLTLGQWQTVAVPMSDTFKNAAEITSLGLRFTGILSPSATNTGSVIIDYIYVGPLQQADHLLIDFEESVGSYEDPVYGGMNYDLEARWAYNSGRIEAPVVNDGAISITTTGKSDASYYHLTMKNAALHYIPGDDDYCEVRFKISGGAIQDSTKAASVHLYFSPDLYGTAGCGVSNNSSASFDLDAINNGEYYILQIPMTSTYYRDAGIIRSITLMFNNLSKTMVGTITVDYIYLGALDQAPSSNSEPLFFDFTNTGADRERYNSYTYGYYNFDQSGEGHWATYATAQGESTNTTNYVIDNLAGTATITVGDTTEGENLYGPKFQTTKTHGEYPWNTEYMHNHQVPLHYKPTGKEYIQVRFKIEDCVTVGNLKFQLDYHYNPTDESYMQYAGLNKPFTYTEGQWITVTHSLAGVTKFQKAEEILSIGLRFVGIKSKNANNLGHVVIDYIYIGPEETLPTTNFVTYGYDSSYVDDSKLSNGSSLFVQGKGIPTIEKDNSGNPSYINYAATDAYTEVSFTFTGTGFDIISRTGANQGMIRAVIFNSSGTIVKNVSVINKGESELYQIPVLSVEGLTHGTYTVKLFVNEAFDYGNDGNADIFGGGMDRGGEFYFDALRIYNPINTQSADANSAYAYEVYQKHGEADPTITEVRNILIDANSFTAGSTMNGVVYLDATALPGTNFDNANGKLTATIAKYKAIGPNNEVYLLPGNAIAFKLEVEGPIPASIDIGAKSADGENVTMSVGITKDVPTVLPAGFAQRIQTSTAQYYPLEILPSRWKTTTANNTDTHSVYVTIYHSGIEGILSITDIKYAYDSPNSVDPAMRKMVRFVVDTQMLALYASSCNHEWNQGEITTAPTCTVEGIKTFTCSLCGVSYTETVSAFGHCYVNGLCSCGQVEVKEPVQETSWKIYHTLNLASDISVNLAVSKTLLADFDMDTVYVLAEVDVYEGNIKTGTETVRILPVEQGNYYYFTLTGLTAVKMNDRIRSVLYGTKDGQLYYSATDDYSIADYAYSQLGKTEVKESLKTLCADLLRYGTKAQIFKSYRTDALADAKMTDEQIEFLSNMEEVTFGNTNEVLQDLNNATVTWKGKALDLASKVTLKLVFDPSAYSGNTEELTLHVSYLSYVGKSEEVVVTGAELYDSNQGLYAFSFDGLLAAELRSVVSAQIYAGGSPVSCTLQYSADTYGNNKNGTLLDLCKALFTYSDSAKRYFIG